MTNLPWKELLGGIVGVAIMAGVVGFVYRWAIRYDPGGPFSDILSAVGMTGAVALALLGGGLLVAVGWLLGLVSNGGF
ncbi:hypothetical protein G9463_19670 [Haloarcula sp. JP-Z28]|uniref:hypothetical protein n=1 Tax=Haloarcula sp. JP-Z28 TaxID=2716715 RepID=UPI001404F2B8|nr:hypothetical protein [Haloarcula sp. JP-Z28]NHN65497.1 hypothetical protein [Haloarcula sp. JP-Z28]